MIQHDSLNLSTAVEEIDQEIEPLFLVLQSLEHAVLLFESFI
jgi:hypothetical protein